MPVAVAGIGWHKKAPFRRGFCYYLDGVWYSHFSMTYSMPMTFTVVVVRYATMTVSDKSRYFNPTQMTMPCVHISHTITIMNTAGIVTTCIQRQILSCLWAWTVLWAFSAAMASSQSVSCMSGTAGFCSQIRLSAGSVAAVILSSACKLEATLSCRGGCIIFQCEKYSLRSALLMAANRPPDLMALCQGEPSWCVISTSCHAL